ncbi:MAG: hypothetical protein M1391_08760 [Bacteroidetes bacterium]|nr:hypothetical protein [Bacteroidota bacterium]
MDKKKKISDKFDCVEMKHRAARIINRKLSKMTREEELAYWRSKTKHSYLKQTRTKSNFTKV